MTNGDLTGAGITAKERLERIETMLSDLSRQLDVRFLETEHRINQLETWQAVQKSEAERISLDLHEAEITMERELRSIKDGQLSTKSLVRWATATLIFVTLLADVSIRFFGS